MSTLNVSNITDGTDTVGTSYLLNGSAKAWVNFDASSTVSIRDSLNFASVTDVGTGDYDPNFSSNMANQNYSVSGISNGSGFSNAETNLDGAPLTNLIRLRTIDTADGRRDTNYVLATVHGDLA